VHPRLITNPPTLDAIAYRVGDYSTFRHALLLSRAGEAELTKWRPGAHGDLAVQMVEWWAYLADVLTFYNERVASQAYLRTADLPQSVNRLIRLLGYRPRPGIGATGELAALTSGVKPLTLPRGFQIQNKPGPGKKPQIFELDREVVITPPIGTPGSTIGQGSTAVEFLPTAAQKSIGDNDDDNFVLLAGTSSAIKKGDRVLLLPIDPRTSGFVVESATAVKHEKDAVGKPITRIELDADHDLLKRTVKDVTTFRILTSGPTVQVWQYNADDDLVIHLDPGTKTLQVALASIVRGLNPGDPIVFEGPKTFVPTRTDDLTFPQFGTLKSSTEILWYANAPDPAHPEKGSDPTKVPPIPVPHTQITFSWSITTAPPAAARATYVLRYGWKEVGTLIPATVDTVGGASPSSGAGPLELKTPQGVTFAEGTNPRILTEDANGNGTVGLIDGDSTVRLAAPVPVMVPPFRILTNLLPVSRGKSVVGEVLGNGNTLIAGQDFVLQNAPVTYLQSPDSASGDDYKSTVRVWVNQLEWAEVRSFYGQSAVAQVFLTREDDQGKTHVVFGDGEFGARLPTGVNNVTASYRYGSGAEAPAPGTLTVVLQPRPGLREIRNPVAVGGGADPDPPGKVRRLAPRSVLTFGRAVSLDDFQTVAAQAPGVVRARAAVEFDPLSQRPGVTVWVGDDDTAVTAAEAAIAAAADPNRLPRVVLAKALVICRLSLTLVIDQRRDSDTVQAAVRSALIDADAGLFGVNSVGIGQAFYDSQIFAACMAVPGVAAVHSLQFQVASAAIDFALVRDSSALANLCSTGDPAARKLTARREITAPYSSCGQRHHPGDGAFFFLPDDADHLILGREAAP
jgi:hypothetical protein